MPQLQVKIFAGQDLIPLSLQKSFPNFIFAQAVKPTDILSSIDEKIHVVGLLDRRKEAEFTISAGEIIDGLRCGLKIYGAAEIGALRARECCEMGMIGVGKIFEQLEKSFLINEDWLYEGNQPEAPSYYDFYFYLQQNTEINDPQKKELLFLYESLPYPKRNLPHLRSIWKGAFDFKKIPSQKELDAKLLLEKIQFDIEATQKLNQDLWAKQRDQFTNSQCHLKWKRVNE